MSRSPTAKPRKAGPIQAITLLMPVTMSTMGIVVLLPVLPLMMQHFRSVPNADFLVPMILTTPALCLVVFSPIAGMIADLVGRRRVLMISMAIYAVIGVAPVFFDNIWAILASRVGVGIVEAAVLTVSTTLVGDFFKGRELDRWLGFQTAIAAISATLLIVAGGALGAAYGWRGPFLLYATTVVLLAAVWVLTWEPEPDTGAGEHRGRVSWRGFPWARMAGICLITFVASIMFYMVQVQLSLALASRGVADPGQIGLLSAIASLGVPIGTLVFQALSRLHVAFCLTAAFGLMGAGFVGMGLAGDHATLVGAAFVNQLGAGVILPTLLTWAMRGLHFDLRGRGTGVWQGVFVCGQFFMPIVMTLLSRQVGGLFPALVTVGAAGLALAALALVAWLASGRMFRAAPPVEGRP